MYPKDADGMANSLDPDQTASEEAVWSWSALFAETYLSQYIEFVRYTFFWRKSQDSWYNFSSIFCSKQANQTRNMTLETLPQPQQSMEI